MLSEIFQNIGKELLEDLQVKGVNIKKSKITPGPGKKPAKDAQIRMELLRFGSVHNHQNMPNTSPSKSIHSFSFFIIAEHTDYTERLELTELTSDHFDKKPFIQVKIREHEYEIGLSPLELSIEEINQFWMAQQKPHCPILFYQARISEI